MSNCIQLDAKLYCGLCKKKYFKPRILPCLHTFCSKCLENVEPYACNNSSKTDFNDSNKSQYSGTSKTICKGGSHSEISCNSSAISGKSVSSLTSTEKIILCPDCDLEVQIPAGGIDNLPFNYIVQNKIVLESLNKDTTRVYCDLCTHDIHAVSRCKECLINLCAFCCEAHKRQRKTSSHHVLTLQEARKQGINTIHRQIMCPQHPNEELKLFCGNCDLTVCRDCCLVQHREHKCDFISEVFEHHHLTLKNALQQIKPKIDALKKGLENIEHMRIKIFDKSLLVSEEVNQYINTWILKLEQHREDLLQQIKINCDLRQKQLRIQKIQLEQNLEDFEHSCDVATEIVSQGSDVEILSLKRALMKRLKVLSKIKIKIEAKADDNIHFHPQQKVIHKEGYPLQGAVSAQRICPEESFLKGDGLQIARHGQRSDVFLITQDSDGKPIHSGGEDVHVEIFNGTSPADVQVKVVDKGDGTYLISFLPIESGHFTVHVKVNGQHTQGSPFSLLVKPPWKKHSGIYHCCTFCSSCGRKDIKCGCGGTMPGYKGCGHGHRGHPGRKHWSCCGKMVEKSECSRSASSIYQFTL